MTCITLYEPYATLILSGEKKIETRSWRTSYRGPIGYRRSLRLRGGGTLRGVAGDGNGDVETLRTRCPTNG